jgi:hypothetical protein
MELRLDAAYYREGSSRRSIADYLGDEIATWEVAANGALKLLSVTPLAAGKQHPHDQPKVETLVRSTNRRYQRLFFQVVVSGAGKTRPAFLVAARSPVDVDRLTKQFADGSPAACPSGSRVSCVIFPEWLTASAAITIVVNGAARKVVWGSTLGNVATRPQHLEVLRVSNGRTAAIPIDLADPQTLRLPLVNGDRITWN